MEFVQAFPGGPARRPTGRSVPGVAHGSDPTGGGAAGGI